jgi:hypothetical protein
MDYYSDWSSGLHLFLGLKLLGTTGQASSSGSRGLREKCIYAFFASASLFIPFIPAIFVLQRNKAWFLYSIFPSAWKGWPALTSFAIYEGMVIFQHITICQYLMSVQIFYFLTTNFWLNQLG